MHHDPCVKTRLPRWATPAHTPACRDRQPLRTHQVVPVGNPCAHIRLSRLPTSPHTSAQCEFRMRHDCCEHGRLHGPPAHHLSKYVADSRMPVHQCTVGSAKTAASRMRQPRTRGREKRNTLRDTQSVTAAALSSLRLTHHHTASGHFVTRPQLVYQVVSSHPPTPANTLDSCLAEFISLRTHPRKIAAGYIG